MKYQAIDDVSIHNEDRVCFYFGFDGENISFAAKTSINGVKNQIKAENFFDVFAWLGFTELSKKLYSSPIFLRKYKFFFIELKENLIAGVINSIPVFFIANQSHPTKWEWTNNIDDLNPYFEGEAEKAIQKIVGSDFMSLYKKYMKDKKADLV